MLMTEWNTEVAIRVNREEGREEGQQKEKRQIALNGLKKGYDPRIIMDMTGLTLAEIQSLQVQMQ
ncbi:MAG: hypothetical protein LBN04_00420 [Oscillospiraceae bacterium]|jgi:predicted transposase/invertase (TIGR01784 family)|nr:hypothetical protein [Oscillospiraceae bacterium]